MGPLQQAKELTDKILKMTKALVLTGAAEQEEKEVEAYAALMEEREPLVKQLMALKQGITAVMAASPEFAAIKKTIADITGLDRKHLAFMEHMREGVQKSYKEVKRGQKIHAAYTDLSPEFESRMFDTKH